MGRERVLVIGSGEEPLRAKPTTLADKGFMERRDLQQWIIKDPVLLDSDLLILAEEYASWETADNSRVSKRIDLLALDGQGRLVVIELKRDDAPGDVHLQAITYAAMVSRFTEKTLSDVYAQFLTRTTGTEVSADEAMERIVEHCETEFDPQELKRPRLMLVASNFPREVTSSAVWLTEMGIDVDLIETRAWNNGTGTIVTFSKLYPVPGLETFTVAPARAEQAEIKARAEHRKLAARSVKRIQEAGRLEEGTEIRLSFAYENQAPPKYQPLLDWAREQPERASATWTNQDFRALKWAADDKLYTPTTLIKHMYLEATGAEIPNLPGPDYWVVASGPEELHGMALKQVADDIEAT
ncbi:hypothetical protein GA0115244_109922 [Streptomyces sp. DvalAA-19]|nr:hypothetical protein GA0115244_109922 [Streptomyces sp. DvalAA-19]